MKTTTQRFFIVFFHYYFKDDIGARAATLAYFLLLSLVPIIALLLMAGDMFFGAAGAEQTTTYAATFLGDNIVRVIGDIFQITDMESFGSDLAAGIGIVILIYGATSVFAWLQQAFFIIFNYVPEELEEENLLARTIAERILAFIYMIVLYAIVMLLLVVYVLLTVYFAIPETVGVLGDFAGNILATLLMIVLSAFLFTFVYRFVSFRKVSWKQSFYGGVVSAVLFSLLNAIFSIIIAISSGPSPVSVAAAIVSFLLWAYYMMQIILIGAEVAKCVRLLTRNRVVE